jgi:hypothetical protein
VLAEAELAGVELARIEFAQPALGAVYVGGHAA